MCLERPFFFTRPLQNDNMSRSIAAASTVSRRPNKEIFQDENCINYSNCLKEYLDRLLVALTDKVKDGTLSYKQGVDIMYHWDDAVYEGEVNDFKRREPNIELLHRYTFLKFYQFLGHKRATAMSFEAFLPTFVRACASRPEIPEEYFKMDLVNRKMLIGDVLRKCLRTACRLDDAGEPAVEKVDASKREVSIAPKPRSTFSRRSFKVPSRAARAAAPSTRSRRVEPLDVEPGDSVSVAPLKSVLSRRDKESTITKSGMDMFVRSTSPGGKPATPPAQQQQA